MSCCVVRVGAAWAMFAATCVAMSEARFANGAGWVGWWLTLFGVQWICCWAGRREVPEGGWGWIVWGGLGLRILLLPAGLAEGSGWADMGFADAWERFLVFDHDVWRFLWDGHVSASGRNPYAWAPGDPKWDGLAEGDWEWVRSWVNHPEVGTVYPPGAQWLFWVCRQVIPGSPLGPKLVSVVADVGVILLLGRMLAEAGRDRREAMWYAWNPLMLKVGAASAHIDSVVGLLVLAAVWVAGKRAWTAGMLLGGAALVKASPLLLLPLFWRRAGWRAAVLAALVFAAGWIPYLGAGWDVLGGAAAFARSWEFNAGYYNVLVWVTGERWVARRLCVATILAVAGLAAWRMRLVDGTAWTLWAVVFLGPTVMPWYAAWGLPAGIAAGNRLVLWSSVVAGLAMLVMVDGREYAWWLVIEHGVLGIAAVTFLWRRAIREA